MSISDKKQVPLTSNNKIWVVIVGICWDNPENCPGEHIHNEIDSINKTKAPAWNHCWIHTTLKRQLFLTNDVSSLCSFYPFSFLSSGSVTAGNKWKLGLLKK